VRNLVATTGEIEANVTLREAELARSRADVSRRAPLAASGALPAEELQHARDAVISGQAALDAAKQQLAAHKTLVDRTTVETHPDVQSAAARVREAYLAYARTALPAPVSGIVAKRSVQVGQRVGPGMPLMAVIPLDQVWVDANFKERQLLNLRPGQAVKLFADIYGGAVEFHGRVAGFGAGTGSAFALLPPQNATGNWIKVVQRVPVRIALDPSELAQHPLRLGLSMEVEVDTHERSGELRPLAARTTPAYQTKAYASLTELADRRVAAIISANGGDAHAARRLAKESAEAAQPESGAR
jgi:membrane fusion protein, multidrug efflux system